MTRRRAKAMAAKISEIGVGEGDVSGTDAGARPAPDDIALDISQSSGAASPPEETGRTKRKRGQKEKENSNGGMDVSAGNDSSVSGKEQTGGDSESLVLWRSPLLVLRYSFCELVLNLRDGTLALAQYRLTMLLTLLLGSVVLGLHHTPGPYQEVLHSWEEYLAWCGWWVGLGILSSVGLGTGLHTFLLYLGPHIAAVTMAAYECGSLEFPSPPYPAQIVCPETPNITETTVTSAAQITIWAILSKVRVEAFCWGAGTAIGELPPYFMARAARLSGSEPSEEEEEFHELQEKLKHPERLTRFERMKYSVQQLVEKVGFFGILACASIPNPLFDLAGITCGHFLIPFWTFFGATLIGKAVIKMHIQKVFVILAFNNQLMETVISLLVQIPVVGSKLEAPVRAILAKQKEKLHGGGGTNEGNILSSIFEKFVLAMVTYFIVSIVHSLAQSYRKRLQTEKKSNHSD